MSRRAIHNWVDNQLDDIEIDKVIQIVTNNHSANMAAKELLKVKKAKLFWTSYAANTVNLMLAGIGDLLSFKGVIKKAKELILLTTVITRCWL